ncbi:hypothetical protein HJG60_012173 [Phyllostomus discolor]|uniref:Uncharacterized protein n=1 Tax=Phyllostomus discolor TaxID=89673 RepID=A0A834DSQ9_9CHIR|nr:hypothetical protein HJG60_012173 [Phyllostomus discolor]
MSCTTCQSPKLRDTLKGLNRSLTLQHKRMESCLVWQNRRLICQTLALLLSWKHGNSLLLKRRYEDRTELETTFITKALTRMPCMTETFIDSEMPHYVCHCLHQRLNFGSHTAFQGETKLHLN